jgi:hypothetical protein
MTESNELHSDTLPPRGQAAWRWGAPGLTLAVLALLAWSCAFNPTTRFLAPGPGEWIVYPLPLLGHPYSGLELAGTFRRAFVLPQKPAAALLSWRCFTNGEILVNNTLIPPSTASAGNWKSASQAEVGPLLRQGTNEIIVTVVNRLGPPALSLELQAGDFRLASDETWAVSVSGAAWRAARAATATPWPGKGNDLSLTESPAGAFGRCWPWLCLFAAISAFGAGLLQLCLERSAISGSPTAVLTTLAALLAAGWGLLLLHNFPSLPGDAGFDAQAHLAYVNYIQDHHRLPDAGQGAEMFQAPLYYVLSAILLGLGHCKVSDAAGMLLLRFLNLGIGAVTLALVFAGLRLVFPGDWKRPLTGLVFAAFLPAQLCLLHYPTNETLSAMFVTAALGVALRLLREKEPWPGWHGVLGIVLGLALLSKSSAVLAVPVILGALAAKLMLRRERAARAWLEAIGQPLLLCLCLSAWHYLKLWRQYGNPLIGGWDARLAAPWWQANGFQTPSYYLTFGDALTRPFFSGLHSLWDGLYSTLWGDGLWGGHFNIWNRTPWNYDFMALGFVLALVPTALALTGLARILALCSRRANPGWLLMLGCAWVFVFAIIDLTLRFPCYTHAKAFFGLPLLLPFGALGALGFEYWTGRGKVAGYVVGAALGVWLLNVYASFWIRPDAMQTELASAITGSGSPRGDPGEAIFNVLKRHPSESRPIIWLASLGIPRNPEQAVQQLEQALKEDPANARNETFLARDLALCGRAAEAVRHAKHAAELAPEDELALQTWGRLAFRLNDYKEAVAAGRQALSLDPTDSQTHYKMGLALMRLGQVPEAARHFAAIVDAQPTWADAQFELGLCLLYQPGQRSQGLAHLKEAVRLDPANSAWQEVLQKALAGR